MPKSTLCGKCGTEPRVPGQDWCRECFAQYKRNYRRLSRARLILQCHREGGDIAVKALIERFSAMGLKELNGVTAAEIVRSATIDYCTFAVTQENLKLSQAGRKAQEQYRRQEALRGGNGKA